MNAEFSFNYGEKQCTFAVQENAVYELEKDVYKIGRIAVLKEYRKNKIGSKIVNEAINYIKKLNAKKIYIYSQLQACGFYENLQDWIEEQNENGNLPNVKGIQSIECLNCGTMLTSDGTTAEFDIQIQITYRESEKEAVSL